MITKFILPLLFFPVQFLLSQNAGDIFSSFGDSGLTITEFLTEFEPSALQVDKDGFIVVGGLKTDSHYDEYFTIMRYDRNGIIDSSFNRNGILVFWPEGIQYIYSLSDLKIESDGKILFTGNV